MGRTNPTYRDLLDRVRERWDGYRRALRQRDRPAFDRLFEYARSHADAAGYRNPPDPLAAVHVAVDLEQEKRLDDLAARVAALEGRDDGRGREGEERNDEAPGDEPPAGGPPGD